MIYSTCFVNFNKKTTGEAALRVLNHNNVEVEHSYAGCCGMPYLEQADPDKVIKHIVDIANKEGLVKGMQEIDGGVTVHHACHARAQNMGNKARDMLKLIPNVKIDLVERCAGHGGTFGVMKQTHDTAVKVAKNTVSAVKRKNNKYMASDCPLAGKHIKQLAQDTNINNDEALHPIELVAKSYRL